MKQPWSPQVEKVRVEDEVAATKARAWALLQRSKHRAAMRTLSRPVTGDALSEALGGDE